MQISGKRKKMQLFISLFAATIALMNEPWYSFCTVIFFPSCSDAEECGEVVWRCRVYTSIIQEVRMPDLRPGSAETRCPRRKRSKVNDSSFDGYKGTCLFLAAKESLFALKRSKHFLWQCCCMSVSQWVRWCWCHHSHSSLVSSHLHFLQLPFLFSNGTNINMLVSEWVGVPGLVLDKAKYVTLWSFRERRG